MLVLGIDPGLTKTGFGLLLISNDKPQIVDYGIIEPNKNETSLRDYILYILILIS